MEFDMMNLDDALIFAQRCKDEAVCSTAGKALIALLDELEKFRKIHPTTADLIFERLSPRNGKLPHHIESALRRGPQPEVFQD